ncbi:MAG TPA: hypothetical protein PKC43_06935 [Phycisphaerales bacterium]|nr:hypothetical protein [Phycisphaerales bacterium]HMP37168.1 hypothetical protein [Phycisphaerales bacterium]
MASPSATSDLLLLFAETEVANLRRYVAIFALVSSFLGAILLLVVAISFFRRRSALAGRARRRADSAGLPDAWQEAGRRVDGLGGFVQRAERGDGPETRSGRDGAESGEDDDDLDDEDALGGDREFDDGLDDDEDDGGGDRWRSPRSDDDPGPPRGRPPGGSAGPGR